MHHNLPPSVQQQDWVMILTLSTLAFVMTYLITVWTTWEWFSKWGHIRNHLPLWWIATKGWIIGSDISVLQDYNKYLTNTDQLHSFALHLWLPIFPAAITAVFIGRLMFTPGGTNLLHHLSGPQLFKYSHAINHAMSQNKREQKRNQATKGILLHPEIEISRQRESGNIAAFGAHGTGKTVFLLPIIEQIIERGERVFIYDEKREYTSIFYSPENTILLAPWDHRTTQWDIASDAKTKEAASLIAQRMIPETNDPIWSQGSRILFHGMIIVLNSTSTTKWGWKELSDMLTLDEQKLIDLLRQHYPLASKIILEKSKTTQSFFINLITSLGWIDELADAWPNSFEDGFSISKWAINSQNANKTLIIQADKRFKSIGAPMANTLIGLLTASVLSITSVPLTFTVTPTG